jgi:hypothetical protein
MQAIENTFPRGLKPKVPVGGVSGTAEAVPFQGNRCNDKAISPIEAKRPRVVLCLFTTESNLEPESPGIRHRPAAL